MINQGIAAGTSVSKGTAVSIVISLGPQPTEELTTEDTSEQEEETVEEGEEE